MMLGLPSRSNQTVTQSSSSQTKITQFTFVGWILVFLLMLLAMAWKPSRNAVLWLLGLIIVGMIVMNSQNFSNLIVTKGGTSNG
jgi:hypothetical protein